jgi:hypothetical protein
MSHFSVIIRIVKWKRLYSNSHLSSMQAFRILIKPAKFWKEIYHFYTAIQKQICDKHMVTHHMVISSATTSSTLYYPPLCKDH